MSYRNSEILRGLKFRPTGYRHPITGEVDTLADIKEDYIPADCKYSVTDEYRLSVTLGVSRLVDPHIPKQLVREDMERTMHRAIYRDVYEQALRVILKVPQAHRGEPFMAELEELLRMTRE